MERGYRLRPAALRDLESIWLYSLENWGIGQADSYIDDLDGSFLLLSMHSELGVSRLELGKFTRVYRHARHLIVYEQDGNDIVILRVLHDSMDVNARLDEPG